MLEKYISGLLYCTPWDVLKLSRWRVFVLPLPLRPIPYIAPYQNLYRVWAKLQRLSNKTCKDNQRICAWRRHRRFSMAVLSGRECASAVKHIETHSCTISLNQCLFVTDLKNWISPQLTEIPTPPSATKTDTSFANFVVSDCIWCASWRVYHKFSLTVYFWV